MALGQTFASHISGDTVATVLVGGMVTVMNGHFEMFAGDSPGHVFVGRCALRAFVAYVSDTSVPHTICFL